jgi:hypothetical protein
MYAHRLKRYISRVVHHSKVKKQLSNLDNIVVWVKRGETWDEGNQKYAAGAKVVLESVLLRAPTTTFTLNAPQLIHLIHLLCRQPATHTREHTSYCYRQHGVSSFRPLRLRL